MLYTSRELSPNIGSSGCCNDPEKLFLGLVILADCGSSTQHVKNLSTISSGMSSSQLCPLTRQMSFKIRRAPKVNGATRPNGWCTFDTTLKTKRSVKFFVMVLLVPILKTTVLLLWSHLRLCTCVDPSFDETIVFGSVDLADSSIRSARSDALVINLVSVNTTRWRRCTNSFDPMRALSGTPLNLGNRTCPCQSSQTTAFVASGFSLALTLAVRWGA